VSGRNREDFTAEKQINHRDTEVTEKRQSGFYCREAEGTERQRRFLMQRGKDAKQIGILLQRSRGNRGAEKIGGRLEFLTVGDRVS
jgi:hypothetical protein